MENHADDSLRRLHHASEELPTPLPNDTNNANQSGYPMLPEFLPWPEILSFEQLISPSDGDNRGGTVNRNCFAPDGAEVNSFLQEHQDKRRNESRRDTILLARGLEPTSPSNAPTSGYPSERTQTQPTSHSSDQYSAVFSHGGGFDCNDDLLNDKASRHPDFLRQPNLVGADQPFAQGTIRGNSSHGFERDISGINPVAEYPDGGFRIPQDLNGDLFSPAHAIDTPGTQPATSLTGPIGTANNGWAAPTTDSLDTLLATSLGEPTSMLDDRTAPNTNTPGTRQAISPGQPTGNFHNNWTASLEPPRDNHPQPGAHNPVAACCGRSGGSGTRQLCPGNSDERGKGKKLKAKMHVCPECGGTFTKKQDLKRHLQTKNPEEWWGTRCCNFLHARRDKVKQHMKKLHPNHNPNDLVKKKIGSPIVPSPCRLGCRCIYNTWDGWFDHLYKYHRDVIIVRNISPSEGESGAGSSRSLGPMDSPNSTQDSLGVADRPRPWKRIVQRVGQWTGKRRSSASPTGSRAFYRRRTP